VIADQKGGYRSASRRTSQRAHQGKSERGRPARRAVMAMRGSVATALLCLLFLSSIASVHGQLPDWLTENVYRIYDESGNHFYRCGRRRFGREEEGKGLWLCAHIRRLAPIAVCVHRAIGPGELVCV